MSRQYAKRLYDAVDLDLVLQEVVADGVPPHAQRECAEGIIEARARAIFHHVGVELQERERAELLEEDGTLFTHEAKRLFFSESRLDPREVGAVLEKVPEFRLVRSPTPAPPPGGLGNEREVYRFTAWVTEHEAYMRSITQDQAAFAKISAAAKALDRGVAGGLFEALVRGGAVTGVVREYGNERPIESGDTIQSFQVSAPFEFSQHFLSRLFKAGPHTVLAVLYLAEIQRLYYKGEKTTV